MARCKKKKKKRGRKGKAMMAEERDEEYGKEAKSDGGGKVERGCISKGEHLGVRREEWRKRKKRRMD